MKTILLASMLNFFRSLCDFLIESSIWVITGILALAIWNCLMLSGNLNIPDLLSLALFLFQIYWLDRSRVHQEDSTNREQRPAPSLFILKYHLIYYYLIGFTVIAQLLLFINYPRLLIAYILALLTTVFYALPIPIIGKRIKELPYAKNVYAPAVVTFCIFIFPEHLLSQQNTWLFIIINFLLLATNSALFDMKDIEGDRLAGLRLFSTSVKQVTAYIILIVFNFFCAVNFFLFLPAIIGVPVTAAFTVQGIVTCFLAWRFSKRGLMFFGDGVLFVPLLVYWLSTYY